MAEIKDINVWNDRNRNRNDKEWRVYVKTDDGREGCLYLTGNRWHEKGSREGNLTDEEWEAAKAISFPRSSTGENWHTVREWEMVKPITKSAQEIINDMPRNRRAQNCSLCGRLVPAGEGYLHRYTDEEDIDRFGAGWQVYHRDTELCKRNVAESKAAEAAEAAAEASRKAERKELSERVAAETGLENMPDWSFDDYRFSRGAVLAETDHWRALEYLADNKVIGFTVREKYS